MAHLVCLIEVDKDKDKAKFTWSEGPASFEPYHLDGQVFLIFTQLVEQLRKKLGDLVTDSFYSQKENGSGPSDEVRAASLALARTGHDLYKAIFNPAADQRDKAKEIRKWFEALRTARQIETLELVVDGDLAVPWNALYDQKPDKQAFLTGDEPGRHWRPFWGLRYNLSAGQKVDPRYRNPWLKNPDVLVVIDPAIRAGLPENQQQRLNDFVAAHPRHVTLVESKDDLFDAIEEERPEIVYWMSHGDPRGLELAGEQVTPLELYQKLSLDDDEDFGGIAFLNACQSAETRDAGSFFQTFRGVGFSGMVGTEQQTVDTFANPIGIEFLEAFLDRREPLGKILRRLRHRVPLGLLYGAYCPPDISVVMDDEDEELSMDSVSVVLTPGVPGNMLGRGAARNRVAAPLPPAPYRSLAYYNRQDRALFAGRDDDVERFGKVLDEPGTRVLVLHGESGVGKSSFLRAGVIPYLEEECLGYKFLRGRGSDGAEADAQDGVLFIRATNDLFSQLADALCRYCAQPLDYRTPTGHMVTVDLPGLLSEFVDGSPTPELVRSALRRDPSLLGRLLSRLGDQLPFTPVLVIDQCEEVFTLAETHTEAQTSRAGLEVLRKLIPRKGGFKIIIALRTEYYGRLIDPLRRGLHDSGNIREYLLTDFDEQSLVEAIVRPTFKERIPYAAEIPRNKYGFSYTRGVPEEIAREVVRFAEIRRDSVLPLLQVICTQLYHMARRRDDKRIKSEDLETIGGVKGAIEQHVEDSLKRILKTKSDIKHGKKLFTNLYLRQPDGSLTTALLAEDEVRRRWTGRTPFSQLIESAEEARLLRVNSLRIGGDEERRYVSLGHDSLSKLVAEWDDEFNRGARLRKYLYRTVGSAAVLLILVVLIGLFLRFKEKSEFETDRREMADRSAYNSQLTVAFNALRQDRRVAKDLLYAVKEELDAVKEEAKAVDDSGFLARIFKPSSPSKDFEDFTFRLYNRRSQSGPRQLDLFRLGLAIDDFTELDREVIPDSLRDAFKKKKGISLADNPMVVANGEQWRIDDDTKTYRVSRIKNNSHNAVVESVNAVNAVAHSSNCNWPILATGSDDGVIRIWCRSNGEFEFLEELSNTDQAAISAVAFDPHGCYLASGDEEGAIVLWKIDQSEKRFVKLWEQSFSGPWNGNANELDDHKVAVTCLAFSPDGTTLASSGRDHRIRLWNVGDKKKPPVATLGEQDGHTDWVTSLAFEPEGTLLASASHDDTIRLWNYQQPNLVATRRVRSEGINCLAFSTKTQRLASGCVDGTVHIWDVSESTEDKLKLIGSVWGTKEVHAVAFSSDGNLLASAGEAATVELWKTEEVDAENKDIGPEASFSDGSGTVYSLAFVPTSTDLEKAKPERLAIAGSEGIVWLWNGLADRETYALSGHTAAIHFLAFGTNDDLISSQEQTPIKATKMAVWEKESGDLKTQFAESDEQDVSPPRMSVWDSNSESPKCQPLADLRGHKIWKRENKENGEYGEFGSAAVEEKTNRGHI